MGDNSINEQAFLSRLTKITEANLKNEQFGVSELAREIGMSRSHVHRRLKSINNKSVSKFIREVRLNKAKEMLQHDIVTVAEIAYDVGFGSPAYFSKCFHEKFGYAPGEFRKYAAGNDEANRNIISEPNQSTQESLKQNSNLRKLLISLFAIVVIVVSVLYIYQSIIKPEPEKSIAILTLKNLSNDTEIQHLADGIMEDIRTRLSHISGLEVKSQISSDKYGDTKLSAREIAKELGVSYILEGSIIPDKETIRINVQLISAKKDDHEWAESFDKDLTGILEFITDISKQVTEKLKVVLSTEEIKQVEKIYTENTEAYSLYQKGRFFWHRRTEEGLNKSVEYFNQALEQDSTYALAYAGLADAYFILVWWNWFNRGEGYSKSKEYVIKALEIDNDLSEAHVTYGAIEFWFNYNWDFAEKEFLWAIELNPNYAEVNQYYSEYLDILGKRTQARTYINKAIELDPTAKIKYYLSSLFYYNEGKMDEALLEGVKALELDKNFRKQYFKNFMIYIRKGEDKNAIDNLLRFLVIDYPNGDYSEILNTTYKESGITGVIRWTIGKMHEKTDVDYFIMAQLFALIGDKKITLEYLKKAILTSPKAPRMKYCFDFEFICEEPEFKVLLEKLNLPVD